MKMTFTIDRVPIRFHPLEKETVLHFVTFFLGKYRFTEYGDDGHKTKREAVKFARTVCGLVNGNP